MKTSQKGKAFFALDQSGDRVFNSGTRRHNIMSAGQLPSKSNKEPIKTLQAKHRHLEAQLAKLSLQVAQQQQSISPRSKKAYNMVGSPRAASGPRRAATRERSASAKRPKKPHGSHISLDVAAPAFGDQRQSLLSPPNTSAYHQVLQSKFKTIKPADALQTKVKSNNNGTVTLHISAAAKKALSNQAKQQKSSGSKLSGKISSAYKTETRIKKASAVSGAQSITDPSYLYFTRAATRTVDIDPEQIQKVDSSLSTADNKGGLKTLSVNNVSDDQIVVNLEKFKRGSSANLIGQQKSSVTSMPLPISNNYMDEASPDSRIVATLETGITNLHQNLKSLEGKYIDLANFYKSELISATPSRPQRRKKTPREELVNQLKTEGSKQIDEQHERSIIEEVKTEKIKLENELKKLITLHSRINDEDRELNNFRQQTKEENNSVEIEQEISLFEDKKLEGPHSGLTFDVNQAVLRFEQDLCNEYRGSYLNENLIQQKSEDLASELASIIEKNNATRKLDRFEALFGEYDIQQEYMNSNLKEAIFTLQHQNEQIKLDLKKIGLTIKDWAQKNQFDEKNKQSLQVIERINSGFEQLHNRIVKGDSHLDQLGGIHAEQSKHLADLRNKLHIAPTNNSLTALTENRLLSEHLALIKEENVTYKSKVEFMSTELMQKEELLQQKESQANNLQEKLRQATLMQQQSQAPQNDRWKASLHTLSQLVQWFLQSMRRLQKVVHRKQEDVQNEKSDFEQAKKDLETTLKSIKRQLQMPANELSPLAPRNNSVENLQGEPRGHQNPVQIVSAPLRATPLSTSARVYQKSEVPSVNVRSPIELPVQRQINFQQEAASPINTRSQNELRAENESLSRQLQREKTRISHLLNEMTQLQNLKEKSQQDALMASQVPASVRTQHEKDVKQIESLQFVVDEYKKTVSKMESNAELAKKQLEHMKATLNAKEQQLQTIQFQNMNLTDKMEKLTSVRGRESQEVITKKVENYDHLLKDIEAIWQVQGSAIDNIEHTVLVKTQKLDSLMKGLDQAKTAVLKSQTVNLGKLTGMRQANQELQEVANKKDLQIDQLQKEIMNLDMSKNQKELALQEKVRILMAQLEEHRGETDQLHKIKQRLKSAEDTLQEHDCNQELAATLTKYEKEIHSTHDQLNQANRDLTSEREKLAAQEVEINVLRNKVTDGESKIADLEQREKELKQHVSESSKAYDSTDGLKQELAAVRDQQTQLRSDYEKRLKKHEENAKRTIAEIQSKSDQQQERIEKLREAKMELRQEQKLNMDLVEQKHSNQLTKAEIAHTEQLQKLKESHQKTLEELAAAHEQSTGKTQDEQDTVKQDLNKCQAELVEVRTKLETAEYDRDKAERDLDGLYTDLQAAKNHIESMGQTKKELVSVKDLLKEAIADKVKMQEDLKKEKESHAEDQSQLRSLLSDQEIMQHELEKVIKVRDDLLMRIRELEAELMEKYEEEDLKDQELEGLRKELQEKQQQAEVMAIPPSPKPFPSSDNGSQGEKSEDHPEENKDDHELDDEDIFGFGIKKDVNDPETDDLAKTSTFEPQLVGSGNGPQLMPQDDAVEDQQQQKIDELEQQVKNLQEDLSLMDNEIAQKEIVISDLQLQQTRLATQREEFKSHVDTLQDEKESLTKELASANKTLVTSQESLQQLQEELTLFEQETERLELEQGATKDRYNKLESERDDLRVQIVDLQAAIYKVKEDNEEECSQKVGQIQSLNEEVQQLKETHKTSEDKEIQYKKYAESLKQQVEQLNSEVVLHRDAREQLKTERDQAKESLNEFINDTKHKKKSIQEKLQKQVQALNQQLESKEEYIATLQFNLDAAESKVKEETQLSGTYHADLELLQQHQDKLVQEIRVLEDAKSDLEGKLTSTGTQAKAAEKTISERDNEISSMYEQRSQMENELSQIKPKMFNLQQQLDLVNASLQETQEQLDEAEEAKKKHWQTLENNRDLIQKLKTELQKAIDKLRQKDVESTRAEVAWEEKLTSLEQHQTKTIEALKKDHQESLAQKEKVIMEIEAQITEIQQEGEDNQQFKDQLKVIKIESATRIQEMEEQIRQQLEDLETKEELINDANTMLTDFNDEKHEIKAKFKHLMGIINESMTGDEGSSYKGMEDEIDLNQCFEALEEILLNYKTEQETKIGELLQHNQTLTSQVQEQQIELEANQEKLTEFKTELLDAHQKHQENDVEVRRQIETGLSKIQKYREKLDQCQKTIASLKIEVAEAQEMVRENVELKKQLEESLRLLQVQKEREVQEAQDKVADLSESFGSLRRENIVLLDKLQKAELKLQKAREQDPQDSDEPVDPKVSQEPTGEHPVLSEEVIKSLSERLHSLKKELHTAKGQVLDRLQKKYNQDVRAIKEDFVNAEILSKAIESNKQAGWNNLVRAVKNIQFEEREFMLIKDVKKEASFYMVQVGDLAPGAIRYLNAFADEDSDLFDSEQDDDIKEEAEKMRTLLAELRQDRDDLKNELENYKKKAGVDTKKETMRKAEEYEDDIDWLLEENRELHLKFKEVCIKNCQLRLELFNKAPVPVEPFKTKDLSGIATEPMIEDVDAEEGEDELYRIESAKNVLESQVVEETKDDPGTARFEHELLSDQDSFQNVVANIEQSDFKDKYLEAEKKIEALVAELKRTQKELQNHSEEGQDSILIMNIKGSLIQFLKNIPITEKQNEDLLKVIFSMMEFTKAEIQELNNNRLSLKSGNRKTSGSQRGNQSNSSNNITTEEEAGQSGRKKKGFLGLFGKKKDTSGSSKNNQSQGTGNTTPLKPIARGR